MVLKKETQPEKTVPLFDCFNYFFLIIHLLLNKLPFRYIPIGRINSVEVFTYGSINCTNTSWFAVDVCSAIIFIFAEYFNSTGAHR